MKYMKKILLAIALIITISVTATAQSDGFFRSYGNNDYTNRTNDNTFVLPNAHNTNNDYDSAPIGGGLLILTTLGAGYALKKRRKS